MSRHPSQFGGSLLSCYDAGDGFFGVHFAREIVDSCSSYSQFIGPLGDRKRSSVDLDKGWFFGAFSGCKMVNDFFWGRKATPHFAVYCVPADAELGSPVQEAESFSIVGNESRVSPVARLFVDGSPFAVFFGVTLIVVDPFKGKSAFWLLAHVIEEVAKSDLGFTPSFGDCDSSGSVVVVRRIFGIVAPLDKLGPCSVLTGMTHSVDTLESGVVFTQVAPTANGISSAQVGASEGPLSAAVTTALPHGIMISGDSDFKGCAFDDEEASEAFSNQIDCRLSHGFSPELISRESHSSWETKRQDPNWVTRGSCNYLGYMTNG